MSSTNLEFSSSEIFKKVLEQPIEGSESHGNHHLFAAFSCALDYFAHPSVNLDEADTQRQLINFLSICPPEIREVVVRRLAEAHEKESHHCEEILQHNGYHVPI